MAIYYTLAFQVLNEPFWATIILEEFCCCSCLAAMPQFYNIEMDVKVCNCQCPLIVIRGVLNFVTNPFACTLLRIHSSILPLILFLLLPSSLFLLCLHYIVTKTSSILFTIAISVLSFVMGTIGYAGL